MNQYTKVGEKEKQERILKKLKFLQGELTQIKKNQAQLKKDMGDLKNQAGYTQPSEKLKVEERKVDANGELQNLPANEAIKTIHNGLKGRGGLETSQVEDIIQSCGWDITRRAVRKKMEKIAEIWDWIDLQSREERPSSTSNRLIDNRQIN